MKNNDEHDEFQGTLCQGDCPREIHEFGKTLCRGPCPRFLLPALVGDSVLLLSFALSLDLRWKGGFDFTVEFTFSPLLF
ncbi:hypothetical protein A2U01_0051287, partial [Trifolium medium]|nr:hypothetical protein [Trifolium medium]